MPSWLALMKIHCSDIKILQIDKTCAQPQIFYSTWLLWFIIHFCRHERYLMPKCSNNTFCKAGHPSWILFDMSWSDYCLMMSLLCCSESWNRQEVKKKINKKKSSENKSHIQFYQCWNITKYITAVQFVCNCSILEYYHYSSLHFYFTTF